MSNYKRLPYIFDLMYDVKDLEQVSRIANGAPDSSDATPTDLLALFISEGLEIPSCLSEVHSVVREKEKEGEEIAQALQLIINDLGLLYTGDWVPDSQSITATEDNVIFVADRLGITLELGNRYEK